MAQFIIMVKKLVQGVSADEKKYLYDQLSSTYNSKYAVSVQSYSPASGQYSTSLTAQTVTFAVKTTHGGTNINKTSSGAKVVSVKIGSTELTETSTAGVWTGTMSASASTNGSQSTSVTVTVNFTGDYGNITRTVNASWSKYAPFYFVSSTKANLATAIGSATANNKTSYAGISKSISLINNFLIILSLLPFFIFSFLIYVIYDFNSEHQ